MRNQQALKLLLVLIICTFSVVGFSHFGVKAYERIMNDKDVYIEGTMIGTVSIAGKTENGALKAVDGQLMSWLENTTITIHYKEKSVPFPVDSLQFDVGAAVKQAKQGQKNALFVQYDDWDEFFSALTTTITPADFQMDKLKDELLFAAKNLTTGSHSIRLEHFSATNNESDLLTVNEVKLDYSDDLAWFLNESLELEPVSHYSLLDDIKTKTDDSFSPLTLSKIATAIYELILPTNFVVVERHVSNELPSYSELGFEATVDGKLNQDLVIANPNDMGFLIEFTKREDQLIVSLKGTGFLNRYVIRAEDQESFKAKTIRQFNPQLGPTEIRVKSEGKEGQLIKIVREHYSESGELLQKELISEDFYPPIHRIEVSGLIASEEPSYIGENVDQEVDEEVDPHQDSEELVPEEDVEESDLWGKPNEIPK